ncbi:MAG: hypothetical protein E7359_00575 [Clostridiales bacterium]|nr:hypothetical protein [Clostridiales bacterium]
MEKAILLNEELINKLKKACVEEKLITIKGVNQLGQKFKTVGRISKTDKGKPALDDDCILLEFGVSKDNKFAQQTKWYAPFYITYNKKAKFAALYAFSISVDNKVIFKNENKEEILFNIKLSLKEKKAKQTANKMPKSKFIHQIEAHIGKPIIIGKTCGIIASVEDVNENGYPMLTIIMDGTGVVKIPLDSRFNTILEETNDGEIKLIAKMDKKYFKEVTKCQKINSKNNELIF